jgi:hypothetical protein
MTVPESNVEVAEFRCRTSAQNSPSVAFHHATEGLMVRIREQECLQ